MSTATGVRERVNGRDPCDHRQPAPDPERAGLTPTGHVVGSVYYSGDHAMHYAVVASATKWQLAPDDAVALLWENGARTVTSRRRDRDPECQSYRLA